MSESSLPWDGRTVGDSGPYTAGNFRRFFSDAFTSSAALQGVLFKANGNLFSITVDNVLKKVFIGPGAAIVFGTYYSSTATKSFDVPTGTDRTDFIILRWDKFNKAVRMTYRTGVQNGGDPLLVRDEAAGIWEIKLWKIVLDGSGNISAVDARAFVLQDRKIFVPCESGLVAGTFTYASDPADAPLLGLKTDAANLTLTKKVIQLPYFWSGLRVKATPYIVDSTTLTSGLDYYLTFRVSMFSHIAPKNYTTLQATETAWTGNWVSATPDYVPITDLQLQSVEVVTGSTNIEMLFQREGAQPSDTGGDLYYVGTLLEVLE